MATEDRALAEEWARRVAEYLLIHEPAAATLLCRAAADVVRFAQPFPDVLEALVLHNCMALVPGQSDCAEADVSITPWGRMVREVISDMADRGRRWCRVSDGPWHVVEGYSGDGNYVRTTCGVLLNRSVAERQPSITVEDVRCRACRGRDYLGIGGERL